MDKNKSRTDMLAAGRKKLQQFRQKNNNKGSGSHGKSTKKAGRSDQREPDADVESAVVKPAPPSSVPEVEMVSGADAAQPTIGSSTSHSMENVAPGTHVSVDDPSAVLSAQESHVTEMLTCSELETPRVDDGEHDIDSLVQNEGTGTGTADVEVARVMSLVDSNSMTSEEEASYTFPTVLIDLLKQPASTDYTHVAVTDESQSVDSAEDKSLLPRGDTPHTSLMQAKEDQVTDIGAMQGAGGLDGRQSDHNSEIELDGDNELPSSKIGDSDQAISGMSLAASRVNASYETEQTRKIDEVSTSDGANMSDVLSGSALALGALDEGKPGPSHELGEGRRDWVEDGTVYEGAVEGYNEKHLSDNDEKLMETNLASSARGLIPSPNLDLLSISLSQLMDLVRGLSEEEYSLILKSREMVSSGELGADNLTIPDYGSQHLLERLKEELFLTNLTKDIFQLQLVQHSELQREFDRDRHRLINEISLLSDSLKGVTEEKQFLTEELSQSRYELQAAVSARDDLQNLFHVSKAEVAELSTRANELQIHMERSQGDLLSLSTELADCKQMVASLQVENEKLDGTVAFVAEEKKKLSEEKDFHFEKSKKHLIELADCKRSMASLQLENSNLTTNLSSLAAEKNMLVEEKKNLSHEHEKLSIEFSDCKELRLALQQDKESLSRQHEKLSIEFSDCKELCLALQQDNSRLKESVALVTEERKKLEEYKEYFALETERLSSELFVLQEQLSAEKRERERVGVDLKEVTVRLEENVVLSSSLDIHKEKLKEADIDRVEMHVQSREAAHQVEISEAQRGDHKNTTIDEDSLSVLGKQMPDVCSSFVRKPLCDGSPGRTLQVLLEKEDFDDSFCFVALKRHLEEVEETLHQLEKEIEGVHTFSASFSKPGGKLAAPAVSKLIQAFESKVHIDEHEAEERPSTENDATVGDPFVAMKEDFRNLRALYEHLVVDAADAFVMLKGEQDGRTTAEITVGELKDHYEALKDHSESLEATNIELAVQCEVIKHHGSSVEAMNNELVVLCEATQKEVANLKIQNTELGSKLCAYESRIADLERQLYVLQQTSNEMTAVISNHLEDMQKEVSESVLTLEQDWNSTFAQVVEVVQKLGESVGDFSLTVPVPVPAAGDGVGVVSLVAASVNSTTKVIEDMQKKLGAAHADYEAICASYKEVNVRCDDLHQKNDVAVGILHDLHGNLRKLVHLHGSVDESEMNSENEKLPDPLDYRSYETLMGQLEHFLSERLELESVIKRLNLELINRRDEFEELNSGCLSENVVCKLIEDVEGVLKLEDSEIYSDKLPAARFESLLSLLVQKYKEADVLLGLSKEEFGSKAMKLIELEGEVQQLTTLCLQNETEIYVLKESLNQVQESLFSARSELRKKASELEQSEQRVSSIREKLGIAVSKGKGLVVQRDGLKQSLAEKSSELERCLQELQLKDARLHEVETKLKTYSEAGERVEALESELSYIRNSATALRESFLLKDSVLQRIEEILEDLDLPEQFHSRDIIEKVDWLARSTTGNVLPPADWDQKSSAGGGSYSDAGFVMMEPWKDDVQSSSMLGEDLKRKYEELQSKFYGLAEQNEMLEQSLMERNNLVQKWEEALNRIDMPVQLRSVEPEDRIQWLGRALSEARHDAISLQQKVVNFENHCGSLNADLEDSQRRISELESNLEAISKEKEYLSERLDILSDDYDNVLANATQYKVENRRLQGEVTDFQENHEKLSAKVAEFEFENRRLQNEVIYLQESVAEMHGNEERILSTELEIRRLQGLVSDVLRDPGIQDQVSSGSSIECFEVLLKKLLENYAKFSSGKTVLGRAVDGFQTDAMMTEEANSISKPDAGESDTAILKKELVETLSELTHVKEERDGYVKKQQSLASEIEALVKRREELELLLNQEEQKSASMREKLNAAVRKGKSVLQQREGLKQMIEEMNVEVEKLKSEIDIRGNRLSAYEKKFAELSTYPERVRVLESEIVFLRNGLTETEQHLQQTGHTLSTILNTLSEVDVGDGVNYSDPIKKFEQIVKLCGDLRADMASSAEESRKSKRAAELLLAELNEVQERNDSLQEELANAASELSALYKERDVAEAAKLEALSRLEELYNVHSLEQRNQLTELKGLKSCIDKLVKGFHDVSNLLADLFSRDLEFLYNLETGISTCLKPTKATDVSMPLFNASVGVISSSSDRKGLFSSIDSWLDSNVHGEFDGDSVTEICSSLGSQLQEVMIEVGVLKEKLHKHSISLQEQASSVSKIMENAHREIISRNESYEAMKRDIVCMESTEKEKDKELGMLQKHIALLFEALSSSVMEIESMKAELLGNNLAAGDFGINLKPNSFTGEETPFSGLGQVSSEESFRSAADKLLFAVRDFANIKAEIFEGSQKQMKNAITDLQKELQEKEIQKERICMELVSQIKAAEAAAAHSSFDLQSSRSQIVDLEKQLEVMEGERNLMEQRVKELQDVHATSTELEQKVRSLTDMIAAKDQEIEALMQALDEEESQMEDLTKRVEELEKVLQQKNLDLENVEASRGKVTKKLSITVSKFDELHQLSASLLAEVEKLQSQLQDRDAEISFLRQEVTRCTNDALVASQMSNKRDSDDFHEFLTWIDMMIANVGMNAVHPDIKNNDQGPEYKELLQKKIESVVSELVDLREVAQSKDILLQVERSKMDDLTRKADILERSLRDKESRLNFLESVETSGGEAGATSEIMEVEPVINKWTIPSTSVASQVRSLRKGNNEQVAIAIDMEPGSSNRLEDEDDDKVHGFKSLTTSRIVPKFTRPVSDMIDGLWVSCDRTLMRQPAMRLGIILYWAFLHALLATFAV